MTRLRVLRIQSRICIGGPALNSILLSAHLDSDYYQTLLVGGQLEPGEKTMEPLAEKKGVAVHLVAEMGRSVRWFDDCRALIKLIRLIRYYRPDIVHTHTAKAGALGRLAAFLCRVPVRVHTFHGHVFHGYFGPWMNRMVVWTERLLAMLAHRIVTISPRQLKDISEVYRVAPARKCRVVRLGFELQHMTTGTPGAFRTSLDIDSDVTLVAILARLVPIKNHQLLLQAIAHWQTLRDPSRENPTQFLIIGDGELRADLEEQARQLGIENWVVFAGWRRDVADIYADIDLNVLVSKNEGTPVTLIEGLACGVPILTTDVGGIRDVADESHGVIVDAAVSPQRLAVALEEMLTRIKPGDRLAPEVTAGVRETFDVSRLVADMDRLYREVRTQRKL